MSDKNVIQDAINAYSRAYMGLKHDEVVPFEKIVEWGELTIKIAAKLSKMELSWTPTMDELDKIRNAPRSSNKFIEE